MTTTWHLTSRLNGHNLKKTKKQKNCYQQFKTKYGNKLKTTITVLKFITFQNDNNLRKPLKHMNFLKRQRIIQAGKKKKNLELEGQNI